MTETQLKELRRHIEQLVTGGRMPCANTMGEIVSAIDLAREAAGLLRDAAEFVTFTPFQDAVMRQSLDIQNKVDDFLAAFDGAS